MVQEGEKRRWIDGGGLVCGKVHWTLESWNSISDALIYTTVKDEEEHAIEFSRINVDLTSI